MEWYDFDPNASLLQIGADYGAMTGLFLSRVAQVTVLDPDEDAIETVKLRYPEAGNVAYVRDSLIPYAWNGQEDRTEEEVRYLHGYF